MEINKSVYTAIVAITLDGKIATGHHQLVNWTSVEDKKMLQQLLGRSDVIVVGMNTFNTAPKVFSRRQCIVLTRSIRRSVRKSATVTYLNPRGIAIAQFVRNQGYKRIAVLGGTQTYTYFLKKKLLNEFYLTIEPVVFGRGLPLFDGRVISAKFQIISVKKLNATGSMRIHAQRL